MTYSREDLYVDPSSFKDSSSPAGSSLSSEKKIPKRMGKAKRRTLTFVLVVLLMLAFSWPGFFLGERYAVRACNEHYQDSLAEARAQIRGLQGSVDEVPSFVFNASLGQEDDS